MANNPEELHLGLTARLVKVFLLSKLPTIIILVSLLAGVAALVYTPREEDPQIKVPMVDILIRFPGASPTEVENLVVINLEKKLWEMEGLEDLYSLARDGFAIVTAKFKVGEDLETSLFKVYNKVFSNIDQVPQGVTGWVVKPMSINDVPIVTLTLYSNTADDYELRRVADELLHRLQSIPDTGRSYVVAGRKRQVRVVADPARLAGHGLDLAALAQAIEVSNVNLPAGHFSRQDREYLVEAGPFLKSADEVANLLVGLQPGQAGLPQGRGRGHRRPGRAGGDEHHRLRARGRTAPGLRAGPVLSGGDHGRGQAHRHQRGDRGPGHRGQGQRIKAGGHPARTSG